MFGIAYELLETGVLYSDYDSCTNWLCKERTASTRK